MPRFISVPIPVDDRHRRGAVFARVCGDDGESGLVLLCGGGGGGEVMGRKGGKGGGGMWEVVGLCSIAFFFFVFSKALLGISALYHRNHFNENLSLLCSSPLFSQPRNPSPRLHTTPLSHFPIFSFPHLFIQAQQPLTFPKKGRDSQLISSLHRSKTLELGKKGRGREFSTKHDRSHSYYLSGLGMGGIL